MSHSGCALVWHVQPRVVIFPCPTHYTSVKCVCKLQHGLEWIMQVSVDSSTVDQSIDCSIVDDRSHCIQCWKNVSEGQLSERQCVQLYQQWTTEHQMTDMYICVTFSSPLACILPLNGCVCSLYSVYNCYSFDVMIIEVISTCREMCLFILQWRTDVYTVSKVPFYYFE